MLKPPANLPVEELHRLFWQQRVEKYERERDAWIGSDKQRELEAIEVARCREKLCGETPSLKAPPKLEAAKSQQKFPF